MRFLRGFFYSYTYKKLNIFCRISSYGNHNCISFSAFGGFCVWKSLWEVCKTLKIKDVFPLSKK